LAKEKGLVTRIVATTRCGGAYAAATRIATGAPWSIVAQEYSPAASSTGRRSRRPEFDEAYATFDTADFQNGYRSFLAQAHA